MGAYRYVGASTAQIMNTPFVFKRYGQLVEMDDVMAAEKMAEGFLIVPDADFRKIGHTDTELSTYGTMAGHPTVPAAFADRRNKAWALLAKQTGSVPAEDPAPTSIPQVIPIQQETT